MMRLSQTITVSAIVMLLGAGACFAQTPKPAAGAPPATTTAPPPAAPTTAAPADTEKQAISKSCSTQATAKGLHGKERKKFRSECKRNGGKEG
jgi:psiF repeat